MKKEIFVPINGFEGRFEISNHGRIISINGRSKGRIVLNPAIDCEGYISAVLRMVPKYRRARLHQLVAEHFVSGKSEIKNCVNHKDENKLNNYFENLEWMSLGDNTKYSVATGTVNKKGSRHLNAKLTESQVIEIRSMYPEKTQKEIAQIFGICRRQCGDIINRVNWKHI